MPMGGWWLLRDVSVQIYPGEMVCLLGGNASGKTTTLKTILGYVKPSSGEVFLDGEVVSELRAGPEHRVREGISRRREPCPLSRT